MKLKITVLFFALFAVLCDAEISRVIDEQWNILDTPRYAMRIYWMRGEAVTFNLKVTAGDRVTPYQELTNDNVHVVWSITGTDAPTNIYVATTGTVVNATNGMVQYTLTPEEGNLTDGEYDGYATAFTKDGSEITQLAVLARQAVTVKWSPQGLEYSSVAFATPPFYTTNQIDGMTNSLWLQALSNEAGIATNTANIAINAADIATNYAYFMAHTNAQYTINTNIEERLAAREAHPRVEASIYTDTDTGSTETIAITNEYTKLNAFEDAHYYTNCTVVSSNSNVVVTNLGTYMVGFNIAGEYDGTPAETLKSAVFANDVEQHHIHGAAHHETDDITQMSAGPGFVIVTNVPCAIDVRIREVGSGTGTYTAYWGSLNVVRMHE